MSKYKIKNYDIFMEDDPDDRGIGRVRCYYDDTQTKCYLFSVFGESFFIEWYPDEGASFDCCYYKWHHGNEEWIGTTREETQRHLSSYLRIKRTKLASLL